MHQAYIYGIIIAGISFSGALFYGARSLISRNMQLLLGFSSGVFFITSLEIITETHHTMPFMLATVLFLSGFSAFYLFGKLSHHRHAPSPKKNNSIKVIFSDIIHNAADGAIIAIATIANPQIGLSAFIGIAIHELIQEIAEFFILYDTFKNFKRVILINILTSLSVLAGVFFVLSFNGNASLFNYLLMIISGGIMNIVFFDTFKIGHMVSDMRSGNNRSAIIRMAMFALGAMLMISIELLI